MQSDNISSLENGGVLDQSDANRQGVMEYEAWKVKFKRKKKSVRVLGWVSVGGGGVQRTRETKMRR